MYSYGLGKSLRPACLPWRLSWGSHVAGLLGLLLSAIPAAAQVSNGAPDAVPSPLVMRIQQGEVARVRGRVAAARERVPRPHGKAVAVFPPLPVVSADESRLALAGVQVEKAEAFLASAPVGLKESVLALQLADRLLSATNRTGNMQAALRLGPWTELAYFARNDGSPQPYFVYTPKSLRNKKSWPVLIYLHGWDPETSRVNPWLAPDFALDLAEQYAVMLVMPHGRTNTDFQYAGELDVMRVVAEVKARFPVDPERIYLSGASMGGAGAWQLACHFPGTFAAVAPLSAQSDWFLFWSQHFNYPVREALPRHVEWLLALQSPREMAENLTTTFSFSQHSPSCFVGVDHSRLMAADLKKLGAPHRYFEDPSTLGHYIYFHPDSWRRVFKEITGKRLVTHPERVRFTTRSMRYSRAHWVDIQRLSRWGRPARVDARISPPGRLAVTTENIDALRLTPPTGSNGIQIVRWNGQVVPPPEAGWGRHIELETPRDQSKPLPALRKNQFVCGPFSDLFYSPFVLVPGTAGDAKADARDAQAAAVFQEDWDAYAEGRVRVVKDHDVTDALIGSHSLVLFGDSESNLVLKRLADRLPIRVTRGSVKLPDGKRFSGEDLGCMLVYPNPLAPHRYVAVCYGVPWGHGRSVNHRFDLIPDFVVYRKVTLPGMGINRFDAAGLFDENWQYDPKLVDFATKAPAP